MRIVKWNCAAHLANRALHPIVRDIETRAGILRSHSAEAPARRDRDAGRCISDTVAQGLWNFSTTSWESRPRRTSSSTQPHARAGMYGVLTRWLVGIAQKAPVLILVEDAHWADAATLDFLAAFTERIAQLPVLLLITHRPEFTPPWADAKHAQTIVLNALDRTAGAQLLAAVVRDRVLPPSMAKTILEKAGGVPLFVEELARTCSRRRAEHSGDARIHLMGLRFLRLCRTR